VNYRILPTYPHLRRQHVATEAGKAADKQSINQSTNQPINQSINQPVNQSINQSINQPIAHMSVLIKIDRARWGGVVCTLGGRCAWQ
jgi:hypothetical protein